MPRHVLVVNDDDEEEPVELPCEEDGTLNLAKLTARFPGTCGLKYRIPGTANIRVVRLSEGRLNPPVSGWGDVVYRCLLLRDGVLTLLLMALPDFLLIPGQTIQLQFVGPDNTATVRRMIESTQTFGIIPSRLPYHKCMSVLSPIGLIGTTAKITSYREEVDDATGVVTFHVKAEGTRRFRMIETRYPEDGLVTAFVQVLPEINAGNSLEGVRLSNAATRCNSLPPNEDKLTGQSQHRGGDDDDGCHEKDKPLTKKHSRHACASLTWWPSWVYRQYDEKVLMQRLRRELSGWNIALKEDNPRQSAAEFSYLVTANLPVNSTLKFELLGINCVVQRLRYALNFLDQCTATCWKCNAEVANKDDVFSMPAEGSQISANASPDVLSASSDVMDITLTVHKTKNLVSEGGTSTKHFDILFPGYSWEYARCRYCSSRIGWLFANGKLKPEKFWGLWWMALRLTLNKGSEDSRIPCL